MIDVSLIDKKLLVPEDRDTRYDNSVFVHIKAMAAKQKGKYYELMTENILQKMEFSVEKPKSTDYDRIVNGQRSEIKGSCLMKNTDKFTFLQIRPNQDYDQLIFSMFYPNGVYLMVMDKKTIQKNVDNGTFKKQHGGKKGDGLTYLYYGNEVTLKEIGAKVLV